MTFKQVFFKINKYSEWAVKASFVFVTLSQFQHTLQENLHERVYLKQLK